MPKNMSGREAAELRRLRTRAVRAQNNRCYWCDEIMTPPGNEPSSVSGDHLVPLHRGGRTVPGNIVAACRKCNSSRHPELASIGVGVVARFGDVGGYGPMADALRGFFSQLTYEQQQAALANRDTDI